MRAGGVMHRDDTEGVTASLASRVSARELASASHIRASHEDALPLLMTPGWPGSILELLKVIEPLARMAGAFHEVEGLVPTEPHKCPITALGRLARRRDG
jgi:transcriptional regulator of acetoin/glycerol metabolism